MLWKERRCELLYIYWLDGGNPIARVSTYPFHRLFSHPIWKKIMRANMSVFRIYEKPHMLNQRNSHVYTIILLFVVRRSYWRSGPINPMKLSPQKTL